MRIAYVRVSTAEQNEQRQIDALAKHDIERWFTEKVSGKDTNRPQLQAMLEFAREGDTIYVHDFSRLARSTSDLLKIVELLQRKKIHLVSMPILLDGAQALQIEQISILLQLQEMDGLQEKYQLVQ